MFPKTLVLLVICLFASALVVGCPRPAPPELEWEDVSIPDDYLFNFIAGSSADNILAVGRETSGSGIALRFDGQSWTPEVPGSATQFIGVTVPSDDLAYAVEGGPRIFRYTVTGGTGSWEELPTLAGEPAEFQYAVWAGAGTRLYSVGNAPAAQNNLIRAYNGTQWDSYTFNDTRPLFAIWGSSDTNVVAVGESGLIVRFNGTAAAVEDSNTTASLYGVWVPSTTLAFAVGENGTVLRYNGTAWSEMDTPTTETLFGVWGASATDVFAAGDQGTILHYDGDEWTAQDSGSTDNFLAIWGSAGNNVYAAGENGEIVHYTEQTSK